MRVNALNLPADKKARLNTLLAADKQAFDNWFAYRVCYRNSDYWEYLMELFEKNCMGLYPKYDGIEEIIPDVSFENDGTIFLKGNISVYPEEFEKDIPEIRKDLERIAKKSTQEYFMFLRDLWEDVNCEFRDDLILQEVEVDLDEYGNIVGYEYIGDYSNA